MNAKIKHEDNWEQGECWRHVKDNGCVPKLYKKFRMHIAEHLPVDQKYHSTMRYAEDS